MKKQLLFLGLILSSVAGSLNAQGSLAPELLYYKFDGTGTSVPNLASTPPSGTTTANIIGSQTQGSVGQCGGALIGNGLSSNTEYVNTGWVTNLTGTSWSISFWTSNVPSTTSTYYILGDVNAGSLRVFTGGVAGAGNWILRGSFTDVLAYGGASTGPSMTTFVYDFPNNEIRSYVNGVLSSTVAQGAVNISSTGLFKVGGYSTSASLPPGSLMDEFRLYSHALTIQEIADIYTLTSYNTVAISACVNMTSPSGLYTWNANGTYMDTIPNISGCGDSILTVNLSILNPSTHSIAPTSCVSYTAPSGAVLSFSGTYNDTIPNYVGCDSVITINLTVNNPSTETLNPVTCAANYTSPGGDIYSSSGTYLDTIPNFIGCDSIITINLTLDVATSSSINPTTCNGVDYTAPSGAVYSTAGTYQDTILNSVGCDSIITINLTVNSVNLTVNQSGNDGDTLTAAALGTFQWINCGTMLPIGGETGSTFGATGDGMYACIITENGCTDTSACFTVAGMGVHQNTLAELVKLYPNPTTGKFYISIGAVNETFALELINNVGQVLQSTLFTNTNIGTIEINGTSGLYFVRITKSNGEKAVLRVIKD
jgi:hypothetical protein